jgi:hypothetical protein
MSKPTPEQLAANIDPLTREYIDAHIRNLTTQLNNTTEALNAALSRTLVTARALEADAARSVRTLNNLVEHDPKFRITRTKLGRIIKELNL